LPFAKHLDSHIFGDYGYSGVGRMKILVLDGNQRSALAVVRSLGRAGYDVTVGDEVPTNLSSVSKYARVGISYPSPTSQPREFQSELVKIVSSSSFDLLIPCTDKSSLLVLAIEEEIRGLVKLALPPHEVFMQAFDKHLIVETCQRLGIPTPATFLINSSEDIKSAAEVMRFPAVLKPKQSHKLAESGWMSGSVLYVDSAAEAMRKYSELNSPAPLLLQERVIGRGCGYFALLNDGVPLAEFSHLRLREKPPSGGVSVLCKSVPLDGDLREASLKLLRELNWEGVAMVEYKLEAATGIYKIMEVNGRFWGSLQLAIDAGVDFPRLLAQLQMTGRTDASGSYRTGVLGRWLLGDLDHLLSIVKQGGPGRTGIRKATSRFAAFADFVFYCFRVTHGSVLRFSDIRPWLNELRQYIKWHLRSLFRSA
jgi:predicted ATP-grasp superfamily ATP-dependent carboligase